MKRVSLTNLPGFIPEENERFTEEATLKISALENAIQMADDWASENLKPFISFKAQVGKPQTPEFSKCVPGWQVIGDRTLPIEKPPTGCYVFDTETFGSFKQNPMLGVAYDGSRYYLWLHPWIFGEQFRVILPEFELGTSLIAHNAAFDIGRTLNSYREPLNWLCTQSLVQAVNGISPKLSNTFKNVPTAKKWLATSSGVSLKAAVTYWVDPEFAIITEADKELRNFFKDATPTEEVRQGLIENWVKLLGYAINDVWATSCLYTVILPFYQERCPHPTSLYAQCVLHRAKLPINPEFSDWVNYCDAKFAQLEEQAQIWIQEISELALSHPNPQDDPHYSKLDWEFMKKKGIYKWQNQKITLQSRTLMYLLKLRWNNQPIQYCLESEYQQGGSTRKGSWGYWEEDQFIKLPHKNGSEFNVGNPLADSFAQWVDNGTLTSEVLDIKKIRNNIHDSTYWKGNRDRIKEFFVFEDQAVPGDCVHKTITRRMGGGLLTVVPDPKEGKIGTAIKSQVRAKPGRRLVGADFSTQETAIAALFADWYEGKGICSNPYSLTQFTGSKEAGTDAHTLTANQFGIKRSVAKSVNFAQQYNCGAGKIAEVLAINLGGGKKQWLELANRIVAGKRGIKNAYGLWDGGTDSSYFNSITERLKGEPVTPLLDVKLPEYLRISYQQCSQNFTTVANWNIQSSGVDILHLFVVLMDLLILESGLDANLCVTRHDEIWYDCAEKDVDSLCDLMQIVHLSVWASFEMKLGLGTVPLNLALFPEINVDYCLRKEVDVNVWDGFGEQIPSGYYKKAEEWIDSVRAI